MIDQSKINDKHKKLQIPKLENTCSKHKKDLSFELHDDYVCQQVIDKAYKSTMIGKKKKKY